MNGTFYTDPNVLRLLQGCHASVGFIPVVIDGRLYPVRIEQVSDYPVAPDLSAEDFVLGLEVLGCRLVRDAIDDVQVAFPPAFRSVAWETRARQIHAVVTDHWEGRRTAVSDYLHLRQPGLYGMVFLSPSPDPLALDPVTLAITVHQAFEEGQAFGVDVANQAVCCPYLHHQPDLRRAWMDGFAAGRVRRART